MVRYTREPVVRPADDWLCSSHREKQLDAFDAAQLRFTRGPAMRRKWMLPVAVVLLALATATVPVRYVESRMDAVTGSMTWKSVWLSGITSGSRVDVSPLETRLTGSGIAWTPSWKFLHRTHRSVGGIATCYECGSAPPIYQLLPVLKEFAAASTDAELREFVRVMQSGTDAQKKAAVEAASKKGLQALSGARPGNIYSGSNGGQ